MDLGDLENGVGGGNNNDAVAVDPADPQMMEVQPFTWLRAAPYIVAMLAGVAVSAVGISSLERRSCLDTHAPALINNVSACGLGIVVYISGGILVSVAIMASSGANCECYPRFLPRLHYPTED